MLADGASFPLLNRGTKNESRRKTCHHCTNALKKLNRETRGIGLPPATRPPAELQTAKWTRWSQEDDAYLREHVGIDTYENIALVLGRSLAAVYKRRDMLGITKVRKVHRVEKPWVVRNAGD